MSARAKALQSLYNQGKVTKMGIAQAAKENIITVGEYREITGETYSA